MRDTVIDTISTEIAEGEERIRLQVADGLAVLTLCRPDKLNGWSWESTRQLGLLADRIRFDASVRAVLLKAEGRAFCAGIDVTAPGGGITGDPPPSAPATTTRASAGSTSASRSSPASRSRWWPPSRATASASASSWP